MSDFLYSCLNWALCTLALLLLIGLPYAFLFFIAGGAA